VEGILRSMPGYVKVNRGDRFFVIRLPFSVGLNHSCEQVNVDRLRREVLEVNPLFDKLLE
jgi:hypothetical protein